jgi:uncharacterized protein
VRTLKVTNATRGRTIGGRVSLANSWWKRLRGLIGRPALESGEGLLLEPCRAVHMYGMTYPIDVAFLDEEGAVVALYRELAPGARTRWHGRAKCALEVPAGTLAETGTEVGDVVDWSTGTRQGVAR